PPRGAGAERCRQAGIDRRYPLKAVTNSRFALLPYVQRVFARVYGGSPAVVDRTSDASSDPLALIFPGQGSQTPGMGRLVSRHSEAARLTFEEASDLTGMDIAR